MLSQIQLEQALNSRPFRFYETIGSTNDAAMDWLNSSAPAGAVVIADEQRQGRGRMGRVWYTPPGFALALSVILKPPPETLNRVSMLGGLAVAELGEYLGVQNVGIKYPNDVQINGRKVCGILPEAAWDNDRLTGVVLGIGVNVRVQFEGELAQTATSLETALNRTVDRVALIAWLLERIDFWSTRLNSAELFHAWKRRLTTIGKSVRIDAVHGTAIDVDSQGALLIRQDDGTIERVIAGDVMIVTVNEG